MGWETLRNGKLLAEAGRSLDVFLTVDKNIKNQQNRATLPVAVIVLLASKNTPAVLRPFAPVVERVLLSIRRGQLIEIDATGKATEIVFK